MRLQVQPHGKGITHGPDTLVQDSPLIGSSHNYGYGLNQGFTAKPRAYSDLGNVPNWHKNAWDAQHVDPSLLAGGIYLGPDDL